MIRFKPRTKYALFILIFLLAIGGVWFYRALYVSTGSALQLAESFLFRRMTVSRLSDQGDIRYFYVTNRKKKNRTEDLQNRFGKEREPELKFGLFDTKIEPSIGIGRLINPTEWFQNEEIVVKNIQALNREELVEKAKKLVQASPLRSLLVVVHGFREAFPSALRKTAFLGHVLDINSPILLFDWPGNQGSSLRGYRRAQSIASESGAELAETLKLIVRDIKPKKVWVIANSMGGQVVAHAFSHLYKDPSFSDADTEFEDVVLTAPDVGHEEFDNQFKREITALTKNLTIYVSSNDRALVMSRLLNREARRGESTLSPRAIDGAMNISDLLETDNDLVTLVDVTPVNRTRNFHNFSLETPEFFNDLFLRLTNEKTPRSRLLYQFKTPEGAKYWVLAPGS